VSDAFDWSFVGVERELAEVPKHLPIGEGGHARWRGGVCTAVLTLEHRAGGELADWRSEIASDAEVWEYRNEVWSFDLSEMAGAAYELVIEGESYRRRQKPTVDVTSGEEETHAPSRRRRSR
jgi:hypothetical protein